MSFLMFPVDSMNRIHLVRLSFVALLAAALAACQGGNDELVDAGAASAKTADAVHSKPARPDDSARTSPGKPSAPIDIDYEIMATPVVGIPLSINVSVSSSLDQPITLNYRINDTTGLAFAEAQAESVSLVLAADQPFSTQQVTVIPQREGRLYLNISAQIETEAGMMAKVMAIPIQVGSLRPVPMLNGELTRGEDGEALLSMPAKED
jgi:hypothetical protein